MPVVGRVDLGSLDRVTPVSRDWGFDRGTPVDRLYIEEFISDRRNDVHGHVLEVADNTYTVRFGEDRVRKSDILNNAPGNARATMVLDLVNTDEAPRNRFDCIICTQTLHLIYDLKSAIRSLHKMLKPGGVLLLTAPTITAISRWDMDRHGDHWRFTSATIRRLFDEVFEGAELDLKVSGNVYAATAFLHGLAVEELDPEKLAHFDPDYEMLIGLRVKKQPESE
jgi:SAM-dependent methyltransferase